MKPSDDDVKRMQQCKREIEEGIIDAIARLQPGIAAKYGVTESKANTAFSAGAIRAGVSIALTRAGLSEQVDQVADRAIDLVADAIGKSIDDELFGE